MKEAPLRSSAIIAGGTQPVVNTGSRRDRPGAIRIMSTFRRFRLPPLGKAPVLFVAALGVLIPVGVAILTIPAVRDGRMAPVMAALLQAAVALSVLAVALPLLRREIAFDDRVLQVKAAWYTRTAALGELRLAEARVVDLREHTELTPWLKTHGVNLPGLHAGRFRLRDGRKAFCLYTDPGRLLALPHMDGGIWLLGVDNPGAVLSVLREAAARTVR